MNPTYKVTFPLNPVKLGKTRRLEAGSLIQSIKRTHTIKDSPNVLLKADAGVSIMPTCKLGHANQGSSGPLPSHFFFVFNQEPIRFDGSCFPFR